MPQRQVSVISSDQLLTIDQLATKLGVSKSCIRKWLATGFLPPPMKLGKRLIRWELDTIAAWLDQQRQQRQQRN
jgi:excisionase family DNA binding protein